MGIESIGENISKLRKEKSITQDDLAKVVCVTAQAVSKWENGGVPDTELLPKIADYFGVSIDTLFGRNITDYSDIENALMKKIINTPHQDQMETAFELCWDLERALCGDDEPHDSIKEYRAKLKKSQQVYSSCRYDEGYSQMGLANRLSYFMLVPEIEDKETALLGGIDYIALFNDLSDKAFFDTLILLNKRRHDKAFTPNLLVKSLSIEFDTALSVVKTLQKYKLIKTTKIEMDDEVQEVYSFNPNPSFVSMLIFARELIENPSSYAYFCGGRNKPYLV